MNDKIRERFQTSAIMTLILVLWTLLMMTLEDRRRISALEAAQSRPCAPSIYWVPPPEPRKDKAP